MDTEQPFSAPSWALTAKLGTARSVSFDSQCGLGAALPRVRVIPLQKRDSALEEEVRTATRIVLGIRASDDKRAACETELVERYSRGLNYLLIRRAGDGERARDLLQETFCIAIEKLRDTDLEHPERLAGYLRGIAVRVALNAGRRRNKEPFPIDIEAVAAIADNEPDQFHETARKQTLHAVWKLLDTMPIERDRELLRRFYIYDQDKSEICRELGLDSLHFNRVLFRAKKRFRKILDEMGDLADFMPAGGG